MVRYVIRGAIILASVSVLYPLLVIFLLTFITDLLGYGQTVTYVSWLAISLPTGFLYFRTIVSKLKVSELKVNKKQDWERLGLVLTLVFTIIGTFLSLQAFYGQTVTQSRCYASNNVQVNMTSPNCQVIQTVSIPQSGLLGAWAEVA
jgi:hypothetical protein